VLWALTFLGACGLIVLVTWFAYPYNISHNQEHAAKLYLQGIIWLNIVAGILLLLPIFGWLLTRRHLPDMLEQLQQEAQLQEERSLPGHSVE
jgi:type VI protein secretion system component VasK